MSKLLDEPVYYILDKDHNPVECGRETWADFFHEIDNRRVAETMLAGYRISTVFLGIPHFAESSPGLFETMVFKDGSPGDDVWMERCSTWKEAEHMHRRALAWVGCCAPFAVKDDEVREEE